MPDRIRATLIASLVLITSVLAAVPAAGAVVAPKVAIIVGPTGSGTDGGRSTGNSIADAASAAGATVVKAYSPKATWAKVKDAVNGANIVIYIGHGNGFPNPYSSPPNSTSATELTDRDNGFGLNRTESGGDGDNWSSTMVYCGEKALLGTLTSSDGAAQRQYCSGGPITPAPHWVLINVDACYAPGASEPGQPKAPEWLAFEHVRNFSTPSLRLGASAYYATDFGAEDLVQALLSNPSLTFGEITPMADGYDADAQRHFRHPDISNSEIWLQSTSSFGGPADYRLAFAGNPTATPDGDPGSALPAGPLVASKTPTAGSTSVGAGAKVTATFDQQVSGVSGSSFVLRNPQGAVVAATVKYRADVMKAVLTPSAPLAWGTTYVASLSSAVKNAAGLSVMPLSWSFTVKWDPNAPGVTNFDPPAQLVFKKGTHTGYQFDGDGKPTAVKTSTLGADSGASTSVRRPLPNQSGSWFYVVNGVWAGYWIRESGVVMLSGANPPAPGAPATYDPTVRITFKMGTHTGYQFNAGGVMTAQKTYTLGADSGANTSSRSTISSQSGSWFYVVNGVWAGYWIRESDVVFLTPPS